MSRNRDRMGLDESLFPEDAEAPPVVAQVRPPQVDMSWSAPTDFVELPSKGAFYPPEHPLHGAESAEIRYMTARDEDILTNRSLLKQGLAFDRLIESVLVDKRIKAASLLLGDRNAILINTRITGYGSEYTTDITCAGCGTQQEFEFDLDLAHSQHLDESLLEDGSVRASGSGTFIITMPSSDTEVEVKFLTGADESKLSKETERKRKRKLDSAVFTDQLRSFIVSVDGNEDTIALQQFVYNMTSRDARVLRLKYTSLMPSIDLTQEFSCLNCGHTADMEVPLGSNFFWPDW